MSLIERYRELYEHEKDSNDKMLAMIDGVPLEARSDARFARAVSIAAHLAACRANWLTRIEGSDETEDPWWEKDVDPATLVPRFAAEEARWTAYLAKLDDAELARHFDFFEGPARFRLPVEVQILQLVGHAAYHRGQVALLVDQLGGETVETDFVDWAYEKNRGWGI